VTDLSPDARALFARVGAAHEPHGEERERVRHALAARFALAAAGATLLAPAQAAATSVGSAVGAPLKGAVLAKWLAGGFLLGSATVTVVSVSSRFVTTSAREAGSAGVRADRPAAERAVTRAEARPEPPSTSSAIAPGIAPSAGPARETPAFDRSFGAPPFEAPAVRAPSEPALPSAASFPTGARVEALSGSGAQSAATSPSAVVPTRELLRAEARALGEAQRALDQRQPALALRLIEAQRHTFAGGALGEERNAVRVLALCALGRTEEATVEAARFLAAAPRSLLAPRVRAACAPR
jgi:hypothetical protein